MKKIEELIVQEGNNKIILLNPDNGHWVRMKKEQYEYMVSSPERMAEYEEFLEQKFGLFDDEKVPKGIGSIYFSVTGRCNLNCAFCTMNSGPDVSTKNDLKLQEIRENLIPKLSILHPRKIIITGGEPLIRKDVYEIIKCFAEKFGKERIILQTNGLLLDCEQLICLAEYIQIIEISIENIFQNTELLKRMESIFECANKLGIQLSLSFVVDSDSRKYLKQAIDICHKYHAVLTTRIVSLVGRALENNIQDEILEARSTLEIQCEIVEYLLEKEYFEETLVAPYMGNLQPKNSCGAFGKILAIHPDGTTMMCGNFKDKRYSMGNILVESMENICMDLNKKIQNVDYEKEFLVKEIPMCSNCNMKYFCYGPCVAEVAENKDSYEKMKNKCFAKKVMLQYAMFYYESKKSVEENLKVLANYMRLFLNERQTTE